MSHRTSIGQPAPLGATFDGNGANVAVPLASVAAVEIRWLRPVSIARSRVWSYQSAPAISSAETPLGSVPALFTLCFLAGAVRLVKIYGPTRQGRGWIRTPGHGQARNATGRSLRGRLPAGWYDGNGQYCDAAGRFWRVHAGEIVRSRDRLSMPARTQNDGEGPACD
jgi:hypothetical protein